MRGWSTGKRPLRAGPVSRLEHPLPSGHDLVEKHARSDMRAARTKGDPHAWREPLHGARARGCECNRARGRRLPVRSNRSRAVAVMRIELAEKRNDAAAHPLDLYVENVADRLSWAGLLAQHCPHCYICERLARILSRRAATLAHLPGLIWGARVQAGESILHRRRRGDESSPRSRREHESFAASSTPVSTRGSRRHERDELTPPRLELGARWT